MQQSGEQTVMIHFQCYVCHMTATCVLTSSARLAWHDHMANHALRDAFGQWVWHVEPLPFD